MLRYQLRVVNLPRLPMPLNYFHSEHPIPLFLSRPALPSLVGSTKTNGSLANVVARRTTQEMSGRLSNSSRDTAGSLLFPPSFHVMGIIAAASSSGQGTVLCSVNSPRPAGHAKRTFCAPRKKDRASKLAFLYVHAAELWFKHLR